MERKRMQKDRQRKATTKKAKNRRMVGQRTGKGKYGNKRKEK